MSISSISDSNISSFYDTEIFQVVKDSALDAIPLYPALEATVSTFFNFYSSLILDEVDDVDGEDFLVDSTQATREKIANIYIERRVQLEGNLTTIAKDKILTCLKASVSEVLLERYNTLQALADKMGVKKVLLSVSIPTEEPYTEGPYEAIGTNYSLLDTPIIIMTPEALKVQTSDEISERLSTTSDVATITLPSKESPYVEFVLAHELVHITQNHNFTRTSIAVAKLALNIFVWFTGLFASTYLSTYPIALAIYIPIHLLSNALYRSQERQADKIAMDTLKSNKGAIAYFESIKELAEEEPTHPPLAERLESAKAWKMAK